MRLIEDYVKQFHNYTLPSPEKCFELDDGDELYIKNWRIILLMSNYQTKYRYYSKVDALIKGKTSSGIDKNEFLRLFQK